MSTTAEFFGEIAHGYDTYFLVVFLTKQSHCSGFLCFFDIHDICMNCKTSLNFFVYQRLSLCDFFCCHSLEVSKVETESVWCYQRTFLFYMASKYSL